jgi:hypothetical protein
MKTRLALGVCLLIAIGVSGCGAEENPEPASTTYTETPLAPYFSLLALDPAEQSRMNREADRLIGECMKEQGFEYDQPYVADEPVLDEQTDPAEWAATYGYGVSTLDLTTPQEPVEPRSAAEQLAYDQALLGTGTDEESEVAYDWEQEGCLGRAYHEATEGADELFRDERFTSFFDALDYAETHVVESEPIQTLTEEWSDCMADAGHHDLTNPDDAPASIQAQLYALIAEQTDATALERELRELRQDEIDLATADITCQDQTNYRNRYDRELWSAHAALVDDFQNDLEQLAQSAG